MADDLMKKIAGKLDGLGSGANAANFIVNCFQYRSIKKYVAGRGVPVSSAPSTLVPLVEEYYRLYKREAKILNSAGRTPRGVAYAINC
jgi:hypothetical protein